MALGLRRDRRIAGYATGGSGRYPWQNGWLNSPWFGPQTAQQALPYADEWTTMGIPAAWRCATLISQQCASLPIYAYEPAQDGTQTRISPTPDVLQDPWPMLGRFTWVFGAVWSMLLRGDGFALPADPDPTTGWPRQFVLLNPDEVWIEQDQYTGMPIYRIADMQLGPGEIMHMRGITPPGALRGVGVVEAFRRNLTGFLAMDQYGAQSFSTGIPSGIITVDQREVGKEQATDLKGRWVTAFTGNREPAVVPRSITFKEIGFSPVDAEYIAAQKLSATAICFMFGVHPMAIGADAGSSMTYGNLEGIRSALAQDSLVPWTSRVENAMEKWTPRTQVPRFSYDAFLRSTTLDRYAAYAIGLDKQFLTIPEVRNLDHLPPLPEEEVEEQQQQPPGLTVVDDDDEEGAA